MIILVVMVLWCIFVWNLKQSLLGSWPISINISGFRDVFSGLQCLLRVPTENGLDTMENLETSTFDDGDIFEWQLVRWHRERRLCDSFSWKIKLIFLWHSCGTPVALRIAMVFCRQVHAGCHTKTVGSWIQIVRQQSPKSLKLWKSYPITKSLNESQGKFVVSKIWHQSWYGLPVFFIFFRHVCNPKNPAWSAYSA